MDVVIEVEARLRSKNQITVPDQVVRLLEAELNDTLVFAIEPGKPGVAQVRVLPRTFAGTMTGTYGTTAAVTAYLREEHADWE